MSNAESKNIKLRVKFSKHGLMKYIGHLDGMRYFQKVIRRTGLDIAYSSGFSPHQIMSFAQPLGVGVESDGEYMDIEVRSAGSSGELIELLNSSQAEGMRIVDIVRLPEKSGNAMATVAMADYMISFREGREPEFDLQTTIEKFNSIKELIIEKKTKKGSRQLNLKEFVYKLELRDENRIFMKLCAGSGTNIKPGLLVSELYRINGISEFDENDIYITRLELYDEKGKALIEAGEHF